MSFGINGPDNNMSSIQKSHHTNDGGAGNLGYFRRRKKNEEEEEQDIFSLSSEEDEKEKEDPLMENLNSIGNKIKGWLGIKNKEEKNPEET